MLAVIVSFHARRFYERNLADMAALLARSLAGFTRNVGKHRPRLLCDSVSPFRNGAKLLEAAATAARGDSIRCYAKDKSKGDKSESRHLVLVAVVAFLFPF